VDERRKKPSAGSAGIVTEKEIRSIKENYRPAKKTVKRPQAQLPSVEEDSPRVKDDTPLKKEAVDEKPARPIRSAAKKSAKRD
jgi:hypothetical protein